MRTLRRLVKDLTNPAVASMVNHIKFVSAVWFPDMAQDCVNRIPFGSDANKKITLCYDDLVDPRPAIERIMAIEISIGNSYIENLHDGCRLESSGKQCDLPQVSSH